MSKELSSTPSLSIKPRSSQAACSPVLWTHGSEKHIGWIQLEFESRGLRHIRLCFSDHQSNQRKFKFRQWDPAGWISALTKQKVQLALPKSACCLYGFDWCFITQCFKFFFFSEKWGRGPQSDVDTGHKCCCFPSFAVPNKNSWICMDCSLDLKEIVPPPRVQQQSWLSKITWVDYLLS